MTKEVMTFEDWVEEVLGFPAHQITHLSPEEQKDVKFIVSVDALIKLWNAGVEDGLKGREKYK